MKLMITGHRKAKLAMYDNVRIEEVIKEELAKRDFFVGLSGMADGVDLWFASACIDLKMPLHCYIPFDSQDEYMSDKDKKFRQLLMAKSFQVYKRRNSVMVMDCESAIVVWDGNKGGTNNCFQQLLEHKKPVTWINPITCKVYNIS